MGKIYGIMVTTERGINPLTHVCFIRPSGRTYHILSERNAARINRLLVALHHQEHCVDVLDDGCWRIGREDDDSYRILPDYTQTIQWVGRMSTMTDADRKTLNSLNLFIIRADFLGYGSATWIDQHDTHSDADDGIQYATDYLTANWPHSPNEVVNVYCVPANGYPYR